MPRRNRNAGQPRKLHHGRVRMRYDPDSPERYADLDKDQRQHLTAWLRQHLTPTDGGTTDSREIWYAYRSATNSHIPHGCVIRCMETVLGYPPVDGTSKWKTRRYAARLQG